MAEKKVLVFICDRDGFEHKKFRGHKLPAGWMTMMGKDLCPSCVTALEMFLEPTPVEVETTVIAENIDGSPRLLSVVPTQGVDHAR